MLRKVFQPFLKCHGDMNVNNKLNKRHILKEICTMCGRLDNET